MAQTVVVTGAAGSVGSRVCEALAETDGIDSVVALDLRDVASGHPRVVPSRVDLMVDDLKPLLEGASTVVHLASSFVVGNEGFATVEEELETVRRVLEAAGGVDVGRVVLLSSAMVYGAWPDNPLPITEEIVPNPNPGFSFAVAKAEVEKLARTWAAEHPGVQLVVLRPTTALAEREASWVARTLRAAAIIDVGVAEPVVQFVHLDDLAQAVVLACEGGMTGVYNVAPDGWVDGETCRELSGRLPRIPMSARLVDRLARLGWRHGAPTPPGLTDYTIYPWVVANDRLREAGWVPTHTNAEAYVEGTPPRPWATMNAKRRQELALGGAALLGATLTVIGVALWRRLRR